ncbi:hypothetical protein OGR47_13685 [Methylocystis sp. MJC1]|jgi:hypothetical protein|uniref:hypothetical protein n=1 Tax=Methylocystis sp. MJC1 TaxID=2654282 RepID=UPI0013EE2D7D|nr:hypothetical protein [Methylocystis sp. MJC1]KAF2990282.1 hypothetical protein MJC1_02677 [Methylocystis sp. MJC1]MBU6528022.1 hypothetical protein [Methylocystis sp. MJC1]UZX10940.1 hypothetical protein OGR47_13685 [Methylocystis sp. MJC1]
MKKGFLSDWTLDAFEQREEERRSKERDEAARVRSSEEKQRSNEILCGEWTVAALQKRFAAIEQRLAALEKREEGRPQKEQPEPPQAVRPLLLEEKQRSKEALLSDLAELGEARIERQQVEAIRPANDRGLTSEAAATVALDEQERLLRAPMKARTHKEAENVQVGVGRKILRGLYSFMITASVAGAIGFGIGVSIVPIEKAMQFRTLAERGLDSLHGSIMTLEEDFSRYPSERTR